ncbi:hypothetical protein H6P81_020947 [Aristolochia fimbriata]|uniref:PetM of cytochrome b6/f complex subunit 7 n=1 Tax=Aristolochia fimbriata TaxID=158543 RepID=A0AAV7DVW3_ARIFI|nr:hypothetical protein H6P81_020947 [Aristolochia fimbriata]
MATRGIDSKSDHLFFIQFFWPSIKDEETYEGSHLSPSQPSPPYLIQISSSLLHTKSPSLRLVLFAALPRPSRRHPQNFSRRKQEMATTSATLSPATFTPTAVAGRSGNSSRRKGNVVYIGGMNSFGGLKAQNSVLSLGLPVSAEQSFAQVMNSLKSSGGRGGGALSSTCNAVAEIFKIAGIMNALVLVGVAVGFVLLRIEASLEEE